MGKIADIMMQQWNSSGMNDPFGGPGLIQKGFDKIGLGNVPKLGKRIFSGKHHEQGVKSLKQFVGLGDFGEFKAGEAALRKQGLAGPAMRKFTAGTIASRALSGAFGLYSIYEGYQEGGVLGAAGSLTDWYLFNRGLSMVGSAAPAAIAGAIGVGAIAGVTASALGYGPRQWARQQSKVHMQAQSRLEMGTPINDEFGTMATMRQRSIMAIQSSKINGRGALSNEAGILFNSNYFNR